MLKSDLIAYLDAIKNEYLEPSQDYAKKENLPLLWEERMYKVLKLDDVIFFDIKDQYQIKGQRGYINSNDMAYQILRQIALPLVSYVYVEKVGTEDAPLFYWKLFVDFDAIWEKQNGPLVFNYGKKKQDAIEKSVEKKEDTKEKTEISNARYGQGKYREQLLEQCRFCPFTMISDERLLIASHIKPWAAANEKEKINPYTWKQIGLKNNSFIKALPMDDRRVEYLKFHHQSVFKGTLD